MWALLEHGQQQHAPAEVIDEGLDTERDLLAVVVEPDDAPRRAAQMGTFVRHVRQTDGRVLDGIPERPPLDGALDHALADVRIDQIAAGDHGLLGPDERLEGHRRGSTLPYHV